MQTMRAQCSLVFQDADLYNGLIVPMKESKELNALIIRCLSAYYNQPSVRELVDGFVVESGVDSTQELIDRVRESFAVQDFIVGQLASAVDNNMMDVSDLLDGVKETVANGGSDMFDVSHGDNGSVFVVRKEIEDKGKAAKSSESASEVNNSVKALRDLANEGDFKGAFNGLFDMLSKFLTGKVSVNTTASERVEPAVEKPVEPEIEREIPVSEDVTEAEEAEPVLEDIFDEDVQEPVSEPEQEVEVQQVGNARNALLESLASAIDL